MSVSKCRLVFRLISEVESFMIRVEIHLRYQFLFFSPENNVIHHSNRNRSIASFKTQKNWNAISLHLLLLYEF